MSEELNRERGDDAQQALEFYATLGGDDPAFGFLIPLPSDLVTDMMHFARFENLDWPNILRIGNDHYEHEVGEEVVDNERAYYSRDQPGVKDWSPKDKYEKKEGEKLASDQTNVERAGRAAKVLKYFGKIVYGSRQSKYEPLDQTMYDLIADLRHLLRFDEVNWWAILASATAHFDEEAKREDYSNA